MELYLVSLHKNFLFQTCKKVIYKQGFGHRKGARTLSNLSQLVLIAFACKCLVLTFLVDNTTLVRIHDLLLYSHLTIFVEFVCLRFLLLSWQINTSFGLRFILSMCAHQIGICSKYREFFMEWVD